MFTLGQKHGRDTHQQEVTNTWWLKLHSEIHQTWYVSSLTAYWECVILNFAVFCDISGRRPFEKRVCSPKPIRSHRAWFWVSTETWSHAPSGGPPWDLHSENICTTVTDNRQITMWFRLNCVTNHTYDVWQLKRLFPKSIKSQFVIKLMEYQTERKTLTLCLQTATHKSSSFCLQ